jgi:hypothetical protein
MLEPVVKHNYASAVPGSMGVSVGKDHVALHGCGAVSLQFGDS